MKQASSIKNLIFAIILSSAAGADVPDYYVHKDTWHESLRASREKLTEMEQAGAIGMPLPNLGGSDFTISAWIKTESETGAILVKAPSWRGSQSQMKALYLKDGRCVYEIRDTGSFEAEVRVNDNRWHHLALIGRNPMEFFIDGSVVERMRISAFDNLLPDDASHTFRIGSDSRRFPEGGGFEGLIDEVQIFNRMLSANEVKTIYKKPGAVRDGLSGWWRFEDKEEGAKDSSGNNNDGRIWRARIAKGKKGKALEFSGRGRVQLPLSEGARARLELWEILEKDFTDEQSTTEMARERRDNIWTGDWRPGDLEEPAQRYAAATIDLGSLPEKAHKLAANVENADALVLVRDVYHLSAANHETYSNLSQKVETLQPAISHLAQNFEQRYPNANRYLAQSAEIKKQLVEIGRHPADAETIKGLNNDFKRLRNAALVTDNPLMDFDKLLFVKRYSYQSSHYYTDFIDGTENPGGNLCILSMKDGKVTELLPSMAGGIFGRYDLSFDGKRIVFDWKERIGKGFRLYEVGIDGKGLRQITFEPPDEPERIKKYNHHDTEGTARIYHHHTDDMHPCYMPDGRIMFSSTRCEYGTLCDGPDKLSTAVIYRVDADGKNMVKLTNSAVSEFSPAIMHDGRIIYHRWEYVDKGQIGVKCLWAMRPDGSGTAELFGNDIALPPVFNHGRPIPGYNNNLFVTLGTPHFPQSGVGTVIRLDINKPIRTREPMTYITPDIDIRTEGGFHHRVGDGWERTPYGPLYMDPLPLSEKFFLVSHNPDKVWNDVRAYGLYLLDEFGNHILIYKDKEFSCWQPTPLRPRKKPAVIPSVRPGTDEPATVVLSDVYVGLEGIKRGTIKYLRIMEQVPRPWDCRQFWSEGAPGVSAGSVLGLKVMHGIIPVYEDGSAHFTVPTDRNIYFQALDEDYMEVQRQRTYINYRPAEKRSCIGCHEMRQLAPANKTIMALNHPPAEPAPQPGDATAQRVIHYPTDVQPVLDKHCISCHSGEKPPAGLDLTGEMTWGLTRSYESILEHDLVATFDEGSDFEGTEPVPPYTIGSHASKIIQKLREGHNDIKLSREEMLKLTTWVDANAQYYGSWYGRRELDYRDHPYFRPTPTFAEAVSLKCPWQDDPRQLTAD
ncbi:MAG TPA: hypothetical protein HPP87_02365 [Planctomycetes bacterium]|nr:hypothetical protein [Planctomycetota bacterium]